MLPRATLLGALVAITGIAGCGDNLPRPATLDVESGTRLRHARYELERGVAVHVREWVFDTARAERCAATRWSDGLTYCTPAAAAGVYADARCTELVGGVEPGPHAPRYLRRDYAIPAGPALSRLFELGPVVATPAAVWVSDGQLACDGPRAPIAGATYHAPGVEVPHAAFVVLRESEVDVTERLAATVLDSLDGFRTPVALFDRELAQPCAPAAAVGAELAACEPTGAAVEDVVFYGDAACRVPVAAVATAAAALLLRDRAPLTGCTTFHALDEPGGPDLYRWLGDRCDATVPPTAAHVRALTPPLALPALERRRGATGARTRAITLHAGALALDAGALYDVELGAECVLEPAAAGDTARCVPAHEAEAVAAFADDTCTQPIRVALVPPAGCAARTGYARAADGAVHAIGAPRAAPYYDLTTGDRCFAFTPPAGRVAHDVGPALPDTAFAIGTLAID